MTFRNWRIGIHIQQDSVAIVALLYERGRWALRRWWRIPLPPGLVAQGSIVDLNEEAQCTPDAVTAARGAIHVTASPSH